MRTRQSSHYFSHVYGIWYRTTSPDDSFYFHIETKCPMFCAWVVVAVLTTFPPIPSTHVERHFSQHLFNVCVYTQSKMPVVPMHVQEKHGTQFRGRKQKNTNVKSFGRFRAFHRSWHCASWMQTVPKLIHFYFQIHVHIYIYIFYICMYAALSPRLGQLTPILLRSKWPIAIHTDTHTQNGP